jgi:hypothetical protein
LHFNNEKGQTSYVEINQFQFQKIRNAILNCLNGCQRESPAQFGGKSTIKKKYCKKLYGGFQISSIENTD